MPDPIEYGLAWVRLERQIQKKLDKLESTKDSDDTDFREVTHQVEVLEEIQELMAKLEPKGHRRERLGTGSPK